MSSSLISTKGLHRGYSCPSLVSSKQKQVSKPVQHSLSVSLRSCQQHGQRKKPIDHYRHHHLHYHNHFEKEHQLQKSNLNSKSDKSDNNDNNNTTTTDVFSPLTENNLKEHTIKTVYGRESRHRRVKCYVDSQVQLLQLEAELERRRRKEIQSLVPLDIHSYDQDVILLSNEKNNYDDCDFNNNNYGYTDANISHRHRDGMDTVQTNNNHNNNNNIQRKKAKRGSLKLVRRWFSLSKKLSSSSSSSFALDHRNNNKEQEDNTMIAALPSKKNKKPHNISFEQYQQDKATLVDQGLNGLSNQNIARALGAGGLASVVFTPSSSPTTFMNSTTMQQGTYYDSQITSTSTSGILKQQQHHQKRDSGVSLFSKSTSKKEYQQQINSSQLSQSGSFISAKYPKMIHLKVLRGAAIQALSSDLSLGEESLYCCSSDLPNCCCPQ